MSSATALPTALRPFATASGAICVLALDHRDALRSAYANAGLREPDERTMLALKVRVLRALGPSASALLLDEAMLEPAGATTAGVFMPLEAQAYDTREGGRLTRLLDGFGPAQAAALGVQGCKLLLYYRDDHDATAAAQRELARRAAEGCRDRGLALVVEPKAYRLAGESRREYAARFGEHVVAAAAALAGSGADLLKLQFPGDAATCHAVDAAAQGVPWTLLGGAGVDGPAFAEQLQAAVGAGAAGFIAGRPIWGGALALAPDEQDRWLREHARPLLDRLVDIADSHARRGR